MDLNGRSAPGDAALVCFHIDAVIVLGGFSDSASSEHRRAENWVLRGWLLHPLEKLVLSILLGGLEFEGASGKDAAVQQTVLPASVFRLPVSSILMRLA